MRKVYLDSNVIMKVFLRADADLKKILEASKKRKILAYVSWLSLTEVSRSVTGTGKSAKLPPRIDEILRKNNILVLSNLDSSFSSGSAWTTTYDLDYSDHLHLLIAKRAKVDYFVTYDYELLSKKAFESIVILDPHSFVKHVLEG